ncbi:hypothetical protein [Magnetospirillum sp. UT-4]|uniref:hypothetical protein n=1 Tax=Magnetospirillum sp. UT-4 TaxID=2681467 RepID=UPI00137DA98A|nr:hypothetical protein [Magnetospirillum sp. UT-4]CAA7620405.1 hypothetical protein MTBUT4_350050 [Magnetospirillum sp. UT-4]
MNSYSRIRRTLTSRMANTQTDDRRRFQRYTGAGMTAILNGKVVDVDDVSLGGLRLPRMELARGTELTVQLMPRVGDRLLVNENIHVRTMVVRNCDAWTHLHFTAMTYTIAKAIIRHMGRVTGVKPFMVR